MGYVFSAYLGAQPLFKYLTPHWADEMMSSGSMLIGTLNYYRRQEAKDIERGDIGEGTLKVCTERGSRVYSSQEELPEFARDMIRLEPGAKLVVEGPYRISKLTTAEDFYAYCMTEKFDEKVMQRFGGACIRIDNHQGFFEALFKKLGTPTPYGKQRIGNGVLARCVYEERERYYLEDSRMHPCLVKPTSYAHQAEVRAIWEPTKRPIEPWPIKCPEAMKFCTRDR